VQAVTGTFLRNSGRTGVKMAKSPRHFFAGPRKWEDSHVRHIPHSAIRASFVIPHSDFDIREGTQQHG